MPRARLAPLLAVILLLAAPAPAAARPMLWYDDGWGKPVYFPSEPAATPPAAPAPEAGQAAEPSEPLAREGGAVVEGLWVVLAILWVGSCLVAAAILAPPREPPRQARRVEPRRSRLYLVGARRATSPAAFLPDEIPEDEAPAEITKA